MTVFAIDPGPHESAVVAWDGRRVLWTLEDANRKVLARVRLSAAANAEIGDAHLAIEQIASYGMPVGAPVFETAFWSGRFAEAWAQGSGREAVRLDFSAVRLHWCGSRNAKEPNVRRALLDRLGEPGTKKAPGKTYGVRGHCWSALALATTVLEEWDAIQAAEASRF